MQHQWRKKRGWVGKKRQGEQANYNKFRLLPGEREKGGRYETLCTSRKVVARLMETPQAKSPFRGAVFPCLKTPATRSLGWEQFRKIGPDAVVTSKG